MELLPVALPRERQDQILQLADRRLRRRSSVVLAARHRIRASQATSGSSQRYRVVPRRLQGGHFDDQGDVRGCPRTPGLNGDATFAVVWPTSAGGGDGGRERRWTGTTRVDDPGRGGGRRRNTRFALDLYATAEGRRRQPVLLALQHLHGPGHDRRRRRGETARQMAVHAPPPGRPGARPTPGSRSSSRGSTARACRSRGPTRSSPPTPSGSRPARRSCPTSWRRSRPVTPPRSLARLRRRPRGRPQDDQRLGRETDPRQDPRPDRAVASSAATPRSCSPTRSTSKGPGSRPSARAATRKDATFHAPGGRDVTVPMMAQTGTFRYLDGGTFQALELPYQGNGRSMVVLLPKAGRRAGGAGGVADGGEPRRLAQGARRPSGSSVELPRFKLTEQFELSDAARRDGDGRRLRPGAADFSGMNGRRDLSISAVIHKAFVDVNEAGTEAAAATAVVVGRRSRAEAARTRPVPGRPPVRRPDPRPGDGLGAVPRAGLDPKPRV